MAVHVLQQCKCRPAGGSSRLVIPVHKTASGKLQAEGVIGAILQPGRRRATPAYLPGLHSNVTPTIPAHIRLYQVQTVLQAWPYHHLCHLILAVHVGPA